jgi:tRNA (guanine-N7-)-methyltransferase
MSLIVRPFDREQVTPPHGLVVAPNVSPLDLEIGCGVGWHPVTYAKENPDRTLIAIEHTREKFQKFQQRADNHALANLHPVHADAVRYVTHGLQPNTIDRVFLLYPNPEPQADNKRWFRMPFFHELLLKMKSGGTLELATNIAPYAAEAKVYAVHWGLKLISETYPQKPRTHFEKKYLARGETCFDLIFQKI